MKHIFVVVMVALNLLNPIHKIHAMETTTLSHRSIMEGITAMNLVEAQKFCAKITESRSLIEANLTHLSGDKFSPNIPTLLKVLSS